MDIFLSSYYSYYIVLYTHYIHYVCENTICMSFTFLSSTIVVTIGFSETNIHVHEDASYISCTVLVLMNSLARDAVVTLSIQDNTARGWFALHLTCTDCC